MADAICWVLAVVAVTLVVINIVTLRGWRNALRGWDATLSHMRRRGGV